MSDIHEMKLRQLDFSLVVIFQEIYRSRRSTAAANMLRLSQPAIRRLIVARADHPQLRHGLEFDTYLALGHLIVSFAGDLVGTIDEYLSRKGLSRRVVASSPMFLAAFAAAAKCDLVVTAPRRL